MTAGLRPRLRSGCSVAILVKRRPRLAGDPISHSSLKGSSWTCAPAGPDDPYRVDVSRGDRSPVAALRLPPARLEQASSLWKKRLRNQTDQKLGPTAFEQDPTYHPDADPLCAPEVSEVLRSGTCLGNLSNRWAAEGRGECAPVLRRGPITGARGPCGEQTVRSLPLADRIGN